MRRERSNENHPSGELPREPLPAGPIFWLRCHICAATQADPTVTLYLNYMQSTANQAYMLHTIAAAKSSLPLSAWSQIKTQDDLNSGSPPRWKSPSMLMRQKSSEAAVIAEPLSSNV